jgi:YfiH family protein
LDRWRALRGALVMDAVLHAHQVHGAEIAEPDGPITGITILNDADGLVSGQDGLLLAVSVADCVPISLVDQHARGIALLHAGWRGVAAGILERGVKRLLARTGGTASDLYCHFGPAICGRCYEVGPEVHEALGANRPDGNLPVDLRAQLARRALAAGLLAKQVSQSALCTRCNQDLFFSHRGGDRERQMGLLGLRVT